MGIKLKKAWGSHLPVLINLVNNTTGPILELGMGLYSTPFLHWACYSTKRKLVSYDNNPDYFNLNKQYQDDYHEVYLTDNWDAIPIEHSWEIAFIDVAPGIKRKDLAKRLCNCAKYIILHDTGWRVKREYEYDEIYPLFKYKFDYRNVRPNTSIVSNFIDLKEIKI